MVDEARLGATDSGRTPASDGWFVLNVRDAAWLTNESFGARCVFEAHVPAKRPVLPPRHTPGCRTGWQHGPRAGAGSRGLEASRTLLTRKLEETRDGGPVARSRSDAQSPAREHRPELGTRDAVGVPGVHLSAGDDEALRRHCSRLELADDLGSELPGHETHLV